MDIEEITVNDITENPELLNQVTASDKYLETVSSLNQNIDFTGLGKALMAVTENLPKIDTTGIANALQGVAAVGTALSKSIAISESATALTSFTRALEVVQPMPSFEGLKTIIQSEINFSNMMQELIPDTSQFVETAKTFYERFSEIFAFIRERLDEIREHFYTLLHVVAHSILSGVQTAAAWVFRKRRIPRSILTYNLAARLKPPLYAVAIRRFLTYAPVIRQTYLRHTRERGNDSDDADYELLVTCKPESAIQRRFYYDPCWCN